MTSSVVDLSTGEGHSSIPLSSLYQSLSNASILVASILSIVIGCGSYYYWIYKPLHQKRTTTLIGQQNPLSASVVQIQHSAVKRHKHDLKTKAAAHHSHHHQQQTAIASKETKAMGVEQHALYLTSLPGSTRETTCVSINTSGTKVVASTTDGSIRVFRIDHANLTGKHSCYTKCVLHSDYCTACDLSIDDMFVFGATELTCKLVKIEISANVSKVISESVSQIHKKSVRWLFSSKGRWIITASEEDDTEIKIFNYSLELLSSMDTKQVKNFQLAVSPLDGLFVAAAAWSSGCKVLELVSQREGGEYKKVDKAMDLPTSCGLTAVAFNNDHSKAITACKDGTLILWRTDVRYQAGEDSKKVLTVKEDFTSEFTGYSQLHFTSDSAIVIGTSNTSIRFLRSSDLTLVDSIQSAHGRPIRSLAVNPTGGFFVTGAADSVPRLWRVPKLQ